MRYWIWDMGYDWIWDGIWDMDYKMSSHPIQSIHLSLCLSLCVYVCMNSMDYGFWEILFLVCYFKLIPYPSQYPYHIYPIQSYPISHLFNFDRDILYFIWCRESEIGVWEWKRYGMDMGWIWDGYGMNMMG